MEKSKSVNSKIVYIIKILLTIIIIPVLIVSLIIMIKAKKNPDKIPDIFGIKPMIVLSGSMETSIYRGDLVFVKMVDTETLKVNDIIAFRNEENTVTTHRVVEIVKKDGKTFFKTKGDNNNAEDSNLVDASKVEGIYTSKIPKLGNVLMFIKEPKNLIIMLLVILVLGLIWIQRTDKNK